MTSGIKKNTVVAVIGAGTMGAGIAQVAAAAGHNVLLYDVMDGAAEAGRKKVDIGLERQVSRGKMTNDERVALVKRISFAESLADLSLAGLVVEAIVEQLEIKQKIFAELESILAEDAILATNTSSISVTAISSALKRPGQFVGMHFFNPAPVMKLVEIVSGLLTTPEVAESIHATAIEWGKVAVHTKSTPGFIVNRVARAYYGEPLRLTEEGMADPATLDALMTGGGGFRMGPFSLMDLIGNDVNFAVSQSVFTSYFQEPRFRPSLLQQEMVNAGRLGRKSGHGFYSYASDAVSPTPSTETVPADAEAWETLNLTSEEERDGVLIALTDGRKAAERARDEGKPVIIYDLCENGRMGFTASVDLPNASRGNFLKTLEEQNIVATALPDCPGLVVMRTLAMIASEGFEAVLQGVASEEDIDAAMRFGVNYPKGPIGWAREIGLARILSVLDAIRAETGDTRYRASIALRNSV